MAQPRDDPPREERRISSGEMLEAVKRLAVLQVETGIALESLVSLLEPTAFSSIPGQRAARRVESIIVEASELTETLLGSSNGAR